MDQKTYYDTVDKLENMQIEREYIQGWIGGYLHNPKREIQRVTDAYSAGYEDGLNGVISQAETWKAAESA